MNQLQSAKMVIAQEFQSELNKDRGSCTNEIGNALTAIEIEVQRNLARIARGETIYDLYPKLDKDTYERA